MIMIIMIIYLFIIKSLLSRCNFYTYSTGRWTNLRADCLRLKCDRLLADSNLMNSHINSVAEIVNMVRFRQFVECRSQPFMHFGCCL